MNATSWLSTGRGALLDELVKIGEAEQASTEVHQPEQPKPNWKKEVAKAVLIGGGSVAAGMAAGHGLTRLAPGFFMNKGNPQTANLRGSAVKVILPILAASAVMMGERFRHKMDEKYKSAPGWAEEPKK